MLNFIGCLMLNLIYSVLWLFCRFGGALMALMAYKTGDTFWHGVVFGLGIAALISGLKQVYDDFKQG